MVSITLDDRDRSVLVRLRDGAADVDSLAESVTADADYLRDRLPELADNGLVEPTGDGSYELTDDGERTVAATGDGSDDDRVDTPPKVEGRILSFDAPPEAQDAVRGAFAFLQYWGEASSAEVIDGVYSEYPAGYADEREWWRECVRDRLAELPTVEPPASTGENWRFEDTPVVDRGTDDGRVAPDADVDGRTSAKFALERLDLTDAERRAARRVFDLLVELESVSATEAKEQVYLEYDAGYGSPDAWWDDCVRPALESLPGVERVDGERERWRYRATDDA